MPPPTTTAWARSTAADYREWVRIQEMKTEGPHPGSLSRKRERVPTGGFTSIAATTGMGAVELAVTDGDRALRFYRDYVGLTPLASPDSAIRLGAGGRELVVLYPDAERPVVPRTLGLYHLAILVPDRRELARVIARLGRLGWDQYPTDHVMTKANYLWDPDGNGIEVYTESPEDGTMGMANGTFGAWDKDGRPRSGRDPIDLEELFSHLRDEDRLDAPMPDG